MKKFLIILSLFIYAPVCFALSASDAQGTNTIVTRDANGNIIKSETCERDWYGHLVCKDSKPDTTPSQVTPIYGPGGMRAGTVVKVGNEYKIYDRYNQRVGRMSSY